MGQDLIHMLHRNDFQLVGNGFGDIGESPLDSTKLLERETDCSAAYGLLGFVELYSKTKKKEFLAMAQRIANNIIENKLHKGFFVLSKQHIYSRFDCFDPTLYT